MASIAVGDYFVITGPPGNAGRQWRNGRRGAWQPRLWTSHPDDRSSSVVRIATFKADLREMFVARAIRISEHFVSAEIAVRGTSQRAGTEVRSLWLNVAKRDGPESVWEDWVRLIPEGFRDQEASVANGELPPRAG